MTREDSRRWSATAATWMLKATALLREEAEAARDEDQRWLVGYNAGNLLVKVLDQAALLTELLEDEHIVDDALSSARVVVERLQASDRAGARRRRAAKLENVSGRTPEEAEAFRVAAARLRAGG